MRIFLITFCLFLCFSSSFSQSHDLEPLYRGELLSYFDETPVSIEIASKTAVPLGQQVDQYDWASTDSVWQQVQTYQRRYDSGGNLLEQTPTNTNGVNLQRVVNTFTEKGLIATQIMYVWNGNSWQPYKKTIQNYDADDHVTLTGEQAWQDGWEDVYRSEWTWDSYGYKTSYVYQKWNNDTVSVRDEFLYNHTYDPDGRLSESLVLYKNNGDWEETSKVFHFWSSLDELIAVEREELQYQQGKWKWMNVDQYQYSYTSSGEFETIQYNTADPTSTHNWVPFSLYEYTYPWNGTESNTQRYSEFRSGKWEPVRRVGLIYDVQGLLIENKLELWQNGAWQTWSWNKILADYDSWGALRQETHQVWLVQTQTFENVFRLVYSDFLSTGISIEIPENSFSLYPNPAISHLIFSPNASIYGMVHFQVLGVDGRVIRAFERNMSTGAEIFISVEDLPEGTYFLRVDHKVGAEIKKFRKP